MATPLDPVTNFAKAAVAQGYAAGVTSIDLVTPGASRFPAAAGFNAVWWNATDYSDPADDPNVEIVRVTNISGETLTVERGQEGTPDTDHNTAGKTYMLILSMTKYTYDQLNVISPLVADPDASELIQTFDDSDNAPALQASLKTANGTLWLMNVGPGNHNTADFGTITDGNVSAVDLGIPAVSNYGVYVCFFGLPAGCVGSAIVNESNKVELRILNLSGGDVTLSNQFYSFMFLGMTED